MNSKFDIAGPKNLPNALSPNEYKGYLSAFIDLDLEELFTTAYKKNYNGSSYELGILKIGADRKKQLWDGYVAINKARWCTFATVSIVANYIYNHRRNFNRKGDADDDYIKAEYLVNLATYLLGNSIVIRLREDDEMDEIIDEVNNIFDESYFKKLNHPELTDEDCFFEAERKYCDDKKIDFLAYQLRDREAAKIVHAHEEIEALAQQHYLGRIENGISGDEKTDWLIAEKRYPEWRMTRRIATICWNLSNNRNQHQDYYWSKACEVIVELQRLGIPYIGESPYESPIFDIIKETLRNNGAQK